MTLNILIVSEIPLGATLYKKWQSRHNVELCNQFSLYNCNKTDIDVLVICKLSHTGSFDLGFIDAKVVLCLNANEEIYSFHKPVGVLSFPSLHSEIDLNMPTVATLAVNKDYSYLAKELSDKTLRFKYTHDVEGVAFLNIIIPIYEMAIVLMKQKTNSANYEAAFFCVIINEIRSFIGHEITDGLIFEPACIVRLVGATGKLTPLYNWSLQKMDIQNYEEILTCPEAYEVVENLKKICKTFGDDIKNYKLLNIMKGILIDDTNLIKDLVSLDLI